jgi:hypothetical protein
LRNGRKTLLLHCFRRRSQSGGKFAAAAAVQAEKKQRESRKERDLCTRHLIQQRVLQRRQKTPRCGISFRKSSLANASNNKKFTVIKLNFVAAHKNPSSKILKAFYYCL